MRNVILGALAAALAIMPTCLSAQTGGGLAHWSAPCFPASGCRDTSGTAAVESWPPVIAMEQSPAPRRIGLWPHAVSTLAALMVASTIDKKIRDQIQEHDSKSGDDLARAVKRGGQAEVYAPVALGTMAVGLIAGDDRILRAGGRITGGLLLTGVAVSLLKPLVGRARPRVSEGAYSFRPLSSRDSWPSGHTAMAFALATSVSDEVRFTPVTVALYGAATLTGWSRLNDNLHWTTDVATGALVGIVSAKLMNGRWQVFGVRGPRFLLEGERVGVGLSF